MSGPLGGGGCSPLGPGGGGGGGAVDSVFGRTGDVVAELGDYIASLIGNDSSVTGSTVAAALNSLLATIGLARPRQAALLTNANGTLSLTNGSLFVLPPATLSGSGKTWTIDRNGLPTTTPGTGSLLVFLCLDSTAFTKTIVNGGPAGGTILSVPISVTPLAAYVFYDDGTNWVYLTQEQMQLT